MCDCKRKSKDITETAAWFAICAALICLIFVVASDKVGTTSNPETSKEIVTDPVTYKKFASL